MNDMLIFATTMNAVWNARDRVRTEDEFYEEFGDPTVFQRVSEWLGGFTRPAACAEEKTCHCPGEGKQRPIVKAEQSGLRHYLPEGQTVFFVGR